MIFGCHIAQPLKHNTTPVQNIQLKLHCSPGEAYGRCIGRDILYRPLVSRLCLHGQLQQVRVQNVISFHLHIPPCSNKFLTLFRFQGAPPRFHRAAACSAVQGQLPSRLGHRPSRRARLSRCRARPGLARPLSPPWAHNHITLSMNCPVYFEKVSPDALQGISGPFFLFSSQRATLEAKIRYRGSKTHLRPHKFHITNR